MHLLFLYSRVGGDNVRIVLLGGLKLLTVILHPPPSISPTWVRAKQRPWILPSARDRPGGCRHSSGSTGNGGTRAGRGCGSLVHHSGHAAVRGVSRHATTTVFGGVSGGTALRVLCSHHGVLKGESISKGVGGYLMRILKDSDLVIGAVGIYNRFVAKYE